MLWNRRKRAWRYQYWSSVEPRKTGVKPKFSYNKTGKLTKKEEKEVHRTSKNIFDLWTGNDGKHPLLVRERRA